jgi:phenylacetate-CoA ligase
LVRNSSSGSTGKPVVFYDDGSTSAANWAFELRLRHWYGIGRGAREARMSRTSADYMPSDRQIWARKRLWHQLVLPGINLADKEYAFCLRKLREFKPTVLWGCTSALSGLAEYVRRTGQDISSCSPKLAIGWAEQVYEHNEKIIKDVFNCAMSNIYGSREVGHIAAWCPNHTLHVNQEQVLVETEPVAADSELGEIIVTPLTLSPMPFIRYRIGDVGQLARSRCACGRTLQVVQELLGRTGDVFVTQDGRMIAPGLWCRLFMIGRQSVYVEKFQIVYHRRDLISIRIVKREGFVESIEQEMRQTLRKNFGPEIRFQFEYVPHIAPLASGKHQLIVNRLEAQH